jgi:hypothetical protein
MQTAVRALPGNDPLSNPDQKRVIDEILEQKKGKGGANGFLKVDATPGTGTLVEVGMQLDHIDRMPLGNLSDTILHLVFANPKIHFNFQYQNEDRIYGFDDNEFKKELADIPLSDPLVIGYLQSELKSGIESIQNEVSLI